MNFYSILLLSPLGKGWGPLIEQSWILLCVKFNWNWSNGSGKRFLNILMYFCFFVIIPPPLKGQGPSFEQTWISFTRGCFVSSLVEIGLVVLEKIFRLCKYIFALSLLSPLVKGCGPSYMSYEQSWIPFIQECFVSNLVEIGSVDLEKGKMWKVYNDNDNDYNNNNNRQQKKVTWAFGLGELKKSKW